MKLVYLMILIVSVCSCHPDPRWKLTEITFYKAGQRSYKIKPTPPTGWHFCQIRPGLDEKLRLCSDRPWTLRVYNSPKDILGYSGNTSIVASSTFFNMRKEREWVAAPISQVGSIGLNGTEISVYERARGARIDDRRSLVASFEMNEFVVGVAAVGVDAVDDSNAISDMGHLIMAIASQELTKGGSP